VVCVYPVSDSNAKFSFVALVNVLTDYVRLFGELLIMKSGDA
jgi:hypothetical protein